MSAWPGKTVILGGGSAGFLSALTFARSLPNRQICLVRSDKIPVIGVGESTTRAVPIFLHGPLALDRHEFYAAVRPIWKLGNRLEWGPPDQSHFNYPFDSYLLHKDASLEKANLYYCTRGMHDAGRYYSLMDQCRSPFFRQADGRITVEESFGYHIDNRRFLAYLEQQAARANVELIQGDVAEVHRLASGEVGHLQLADGRQVAGDFFVDCSGFRSLLLGETLGEHYQPYDDTLFCDTAAIGSWKRGDAVKPFTTVETMRHGWCWKIEFVDQITRGYVFSSQFCGETEAIDELKEKNPRLGDDIRVIRFPRGRYENYWVGNVAAIGNASGFVEPLEATALQLITEQLRYLCKALLDSTTRPPPRMREWENRRFRKRWDDVRDFLAVHYKFNRRIDSPFWLHCRQDTKLGAAAEIVEYYRQVGPSLLANQLSSESSIFGFEGYLTLLLGQQVETAYQPPFSEQEWTAWSAYRTKIHNQAARALSMSEAMKIMFPPPA